MFFVDIGSSTIKVYRLLNEALEHIHERTIPFKSEFDKDSGISPENYNAIINYFNELKVKYGVNSENTSLYATGIWREFSINALEEFKKNFKKDTGLNFNIITHQQEADYLKKANEGDYNGKKVLIINTGGKTTEFVTIENGKTIEIKISNIGIADMLNKFPNVDDGYAPASLKDMMEFADGLIKDIEFEKDYNTAIFRELDFQRNAGYLLEENKLFEDSNHPLMISMDNLEKSVERIFTGFTLAELYTQRPHNPSWMDGARHFAALSLALLKKIGVEFAVPSNLNLINGVVKTLDN